MLRCISLLNQRTKRITINLLNFIFLDIGRISTIHFWPFWSDDKNLWEYTNNNGITIVLRRTDWEIVDDVFSYGYHVGAKRK
jgi:hypothetical protein